MFYAKKLLMRAYSLLELQKMNKTERMALYKELAAMGMFYAVEKGNVFAIV
jgi:hypothetical protein